MDVSLLDFARGPALQVSIIIFLFGLVWRLVGLFLLPWRRTKARPRAEAPGRLSGALRGIVGRMWPHKSFVRRSLFSTINGYVFHLGLAIVVFGFGPHIAFFDDLLGVSWPNLPSPLIYVVGAITLGSLIASLARRLTHPVQRMISNIDDYLSWLVTILPVATGLMAAAHAGPRYEIMLAIHLLSVCALLVWLPFGKLMHAFLFVISRGATGARLGQRGAKI